MKAFVTVIGQDKIGIIQGVTTILSENDVNILDINQTILQNFFTMVMLVDLGKTKLDFYSLKEKLDLKGKELDVQIRIQHEDIFNSMHKI